MARKPKWLTDDEKSAWKNFTLMQLQLSALLSSELASDGLSSQDYTVLAELSDRPDHMARQNELGQQLGWEKSRISHQVSRMESRGLVAKKKCPTDQRGWFVAMTPVGSAAITAAAPGHVQAVRRNFIDLLTPSQLRQLEVISKTVLANLEATDS
jgi:DNA-binding MarR family transcriptional regulator